MSIKDKLLVTIHFFTPSSLIRRGIFNYNKKAEWRRYGIERSGSDFIRARLWDSEEASGGKFPPYAQLTKKIRALRGLPTKDNYTFFFTGKLYKSMEILPKKDSVIIKYADFSPSGVSYDEIFTIFGGGRREVLGRLWRAEDKEAVVDNILRSFRKKIR